MCFCVCGIRRSTLGAQHRERQRERHDRKKRVARGVPGREPSRRRLIGSALAAHDTWVKGVLPSRYLVKGLGFKDSGIFR